MQSRWTDHVPGLQRERTLELKEHARSQKFSQVSQPRFDFCCRHLLPAVGHVLANAATFKTLHQLQKNSRGKPRVFASPTSTDTCVLAVAFECAFGA